MTDVRVIDRSGATLTGLRVCVHECAERAELRAGRIPLGIRDDGGATLTFNGPRDERSANTYVAPSLGVHRIIRPGGRTEQQQ